MSNRAGPWPATAITAVTSTAANLLGYVFNLVSSRALGVRGYGELAALLAVVTAAMVPAMALEATVARRVAREQAPPHLGRSALLGGVAVGAVVMASAPALRLALRLPGYLPLWWTAASAVPMTVAFAWQGVLLGARRFLAFGAFLVSVQAARVAAGVLAAVTGRSAGTALAAMTLFTGAVALACARPVLRLPAGRSDRALWPEAWRDAAPFAGLLTLSGLDLLLARHYLSPQGSGGYAAGNLVTRAYFWGPGFIALAGYPRFALPSQRAAALRRSAILLACLAGAGLAAAMAGPQIIPALIGPGYRSMARLAWLFGANGLALAGAQLGLYAGLAVGDRRLGRLVWLTCLAEALVIVTVAHESVRQIATVALGGSTLLATAAALLTYRSLPRPERSQARGTQRPRSQLSVVAAARRGPDPPARRHGPRAS